MGKGSSKTTSTTSPNPQAMSAYTDLLSRAAGVSNQPYQAYGGELVAPINQQQQLGIGNINQNANYAQPFMDMAGSYAQNGAAAIDPSQIQRYMDPFTNQVIQATQADFNHQNAVQQSQVTGNAAAQGALGGDRVGVAQALTAEGQSRSQAPIIAGLRNTGWQNALTAAQGDRDAQARGAYNLSNIGTAGQNAALSGAGAQLGAGNLQYAQQQAQDTANYGQWQNEQAYPYQQLDWYSQLVGGVGPALGGSSTTEGPKPSIWNQILGLGVAGVGAASGLGWSPFGKADGGGVSGYAVGGTPYASAEGYIPKFKLGHIGTGAPGAPRAADTSNPLLSNSQMKEFTSDLAKWYKGKDSGLPASALADQGPQQSSVLASGWGDGWGGGLYRDGGPVRRGYESGGMPVAGVGGALLEDYPTEESILTPERKAMLNGVMNRGLGSPSIVPPQEPPMARNFGDRFTDTQEQGVADISDPTIRQNYNDLLAVGTTLPEYSQQNGVAAAPVPDGPATTMVAQSRPSESQGLPPEITRGVSRPPQEEPEQATAYADRGVGQRILPGASQVGLKDQEVASEKGEGLFGLSPAARMGLIAAGLGMMASRSPNVGQAIGEGGLLGVGTYSGIKKQEAKDVMDAKKLAQEADETAKKLSMESERIAIARDKATKDDIPAGYRQTKAGYEAIPGGPADPAEVKKLAEAKNPVVSSSQDVEGAAEVFLKSGKMPPNIGRGIQGQAESREIRKRAYEKAAERGMDPVDLPKQWQKFNSEQVAIQRFQSGPQGNVARSLNVVTEHAETLRQLGQALKNGDVRLFNELSQRWAQATGNAAPTNFKMAAQIVGTELVKALGVSGAGTREERESLGRTLSQAASPDQIEGAINGVIRPLLTGQLKGLRQQFKAATGQPEKAFNEMLSPAAVEWMDGHGGTEATPKKGERKKFKQGEGEWDGTKWVPVK